jgi:uncharacterized membrane protein (UPF0127 family)
VIRNKTKKTIIAKEFLKKGTFGKIKGLLGEKMPQAIIFNTRFGIHTFFLKFPIDVIILDKKNKIVTLKKKLKPNRVFLWNIRFNQVIELPGGSLEKSKTEVDDSILLSEESHNI